MNITKLWAKHNRVKREPSQESLALHSTHLAKQYTRQTLVLVLVWSRPVHCALGLFGPSLTETLIWLAKLLRQGHRHGTINNGWMDGWRCHGVHTNPLIYTFGPAHLVGSDSCFLLWRLCFPSCGWMPHGCRVQVCVRYLMLCSGKLGHLSFRMWMLCLLGLWVFSGFLRVTGIPQLIFIIVITLNH